MIRVCAHLGRGDDSGVVGCRGEGEGHVCLLFLVLRGDGRERGEGD